MAENDSKKNKPISVNDAKAISSYANFCRVTGSPEELIVDFGMNSQPIGCLLYTSPSPRDRTRSRMPSSA